MASRMRARIMGYYKRSKLCADSLMGAGCRVSYSAIVSPEAEEMC